MKAAARAVSRLATAVRVALPASRTAFQFLRAMLAVPRIPQRQTGVGIGSIRGGAGTVRRTRERVGTVTRRGQGGRTAGLHLAPVAGRGRRPQGGAGGGCASRG